MPKQYDAVAFLAEYHAAAKAGMTAEETAYLMGLPKATFHSRCFSLRERGIRLPKLRHTRKLAAKPVQVKEPTLGDEMEFDTAFLHQPVKVVVHAPVSFTITITTEGVNAAV
jgi:hypothetical protein